MYSYAYFIIDWLKIIKTSKAMIIGINKEAALLRYHNYM